jgi:hypothetical protein
MALTIVDRPPATCEIHVPISPTKAFFRSVRTLAHSLQANGGSLAESSLIVTVGDDEQYDIAAVETWSAEYPIEWRWLEPDLWERHSYYGTALRRFVGPFESPLVLMLDADTVLVRPIDDLLREVERRHALTALVGMGSPFPDFENAHDHWRTIYAEAGLGEPAFTERHTYWRAEWGDPPHRACPPYFNLGMVLAPRELMSAVGAAIFDELPAIDRWGSTIFRCQIALGLAVHRLELPWFGAERRFNFPNWPTFAETYPADADDVRILHYWSTDELDKYKELVDDELFARLPARTDLHPVNRLVADAVGAAFA